MFISKINIKGFRNFNQTEVQFKDGFNIIIGHNNAGKTNLLKALFLVLDCQSSKRLELDDFYNNSSLSDLKTSPPEIIISLTISQSQDETLNSDDLVTVSKWLTNINSPYEAQLTYKFFLPEKERANYINEVSSATDIETVWQIIRHDFLRLYTAKIFCGDPRLNTVADNESLQKFDFHFLDAIRDVERDMLTGKSALLREVLAFFIDYDIKNDINKTDDNKKGEIKQRKKDFSTKAAALILELQDRMVAGKQHMLSYAEETGASFNKSKPNFDGSISDIELFTALKLIIEHDTGLKIPATHNGLGYNNLIYISLLLAKMQINSDGNYLGSNAKIFPVLAIEEPEAHLHPAMQYKFLKFLKNNLKDTKKARQIFITTHSTQIASAISLDEIICIYSHGNETKIGYPGKAFPNNSEGNKSKAYVQRFFDATKSDMLFANKVILVEGIAEQLILSILADYLGKSLEDNHVAVINVGGRYFEHFLTMFNSLNTATINKKIACLTDRDPIRKDKTKSTFTACYPIEFNVDNTKYEYREHSSQSLTKYQSHANIRFFSQDANIGKTFEYDLILHNPSLQLLITDSTNNKGELINLMQCYKQNKPLADYISCLRSSVENKRLEDGVASNMNWNDDQKKKAIIATRYLNSIGKGENALELAHILDKNFQQSTPEAFVVPTYIKDAIDWICQP
ncbi:AAA family ATPase [Hymenobacter aerilatus]|uniref:AAA family ATPase n=1 Tax=Hymenobacter aerilatus TaxID=2932251 RepID=A0A8T9SVY2_9BACT|nr:AAA family ATPase [Hymenobacter aerilatus]UOR04883.1 AAA family ATPase [Hymenobacter aerilatus]